MSVETKLIAVENPENLNLVFGQSHFIKTVEDVHEAIVCTVPNAQFGLAFCEASGERLIRWSGTDEELTKLAIKNAEAVGAGHTFFIFMKDMFPINIKNTLLAIPEIVRLFCCTANPLQVVVAESEQGRGVLGVIDGGSPLGVETEEDIEKRKGFLRMIKYKM